jgi:hypothetical protein
MITGSQANSNGSDGLNFDFSGGNIINSRANSNGECGMHLRPGGTITDNQASHKKDCGITIDGTANLTGNTVNDNGGFGDRCLVSQQFVLKSSAMTRMVRAENVKRVTKSSGGTSI